MTTLDPELTAQARQAIRAVLANLDNWRPFHQPGECLLTLLGQTSAGCIEPLFARAEELIFAQLRPGQPLGPGETLPGVIAAWNDAPGRTRDEVRELLERAGGVK
jgi:hypothetical protein